MYWSWEDDGARKTRREKVGKLYGIPARKSRKGLHVLVEATSKQNSQTKNRWIQALQFAATRRAQIEQEGFGEFCRANGGIAGCARKWAARKRGLKTARVPRPPGLKEQPQIDPATMAAGDIRVSPGRSLVSGAFSFVAWECIDSFVGSPSVGESLTGAAWRRGS